MEGATGLPHGGDGLRRRRVGLNLFRATHAWVQQVTQGLQQALQVLQTAKAGLNQPKPPAPAKEEKAEEHLPAEQ